MNRGSLFWTLLQSVTLSYSGWASVAVIRDQLITSRGLLTDADLAAFLGLSQITPGPLGFYLLFVGYSIGSLTGALLAWLALVVPAFLILPIANLFRRGREHPGLRGAVSGIVAASAALMLWNAIELAPSALTTRSAYGISVACLLALGSGRIASFSVVVAAAVAGTVLLSGIR